MPASFKRLKQRAYEAIIAAPNRDWRKMLARKRAHAFISAAAATAVCLTISSTAPALLEGASIRPMDDFSDGGSGIGGLRNLFPDDSRQSVSVFAAVGYASTSPSEAAASYDCVETPAASTMGGSASAAPTNGGIICLGPHDAIEFHELRGNADRGGVEHAMDVVPSSVRSHIADDQLFVSTSHDDGSVPRESSGNTPGRKASNLERRSTASISHARKGSSLHIAGCSRCGQIVQSSPRRAKSFVVALAMDFVRAVRSAGAPRHRGAPRAAS